MSLPTVAEMNELEFGDLLRDVIRDEVERFKLPRYLSTKSAGQIAGVAPATIRAWVKRGELRDFWAGNDLRVLLSDLQLYLARKHPE